MIKQERQIVRRTFTVIGVIALLVIFFSCNKEEPQPATQAVDCNCDRVQSHNLFNLPSGQQFGDYVTINDCSGVQINGQWNTTWGDTEPVNGTCL